MNSTVALPIEYDFEAHPDTNGYYGTYLDLYLAEFTQNLQWYLDNLDYTEGWTWFNEDGTAMSNEDVAAMTTTDKAEKFVAGLYTAASSGGMMGGNMGGRPDGNMPGFDVIDYGQEDYVFGDEEQGASLLFLCLAGKNKRISYSLGKDIMISISREGLEPIVATKWK